MKLVETAKLSIVKLVTKVYIAIVLDNNFYYVKTRYVKRNGIEEEDKKFSLVGDKLPPVMVKYLNKIQKKYAYTYISTILSAINAGAIRGCDTKEYKKMHIETDSIIKISIDNEWSAYSSIYAIDELKNSFNSINGIDFVFPREIVLNHLLNNEEIDGQNIYIINATSYVIVSVFSQAGLLFSAHFVYKEDEEDMAQNENESMEEMSELIKETKQGNEEIEDVLQLDDMDNDVFDDDLDDLDDLEDIENPELDDLESMEGDEDEEESAMELDTPKEVQLTKKDYLVIEFIQNSIEDFYKNSFYKSEFIKKAKIYDVCKESNSAKVLSNFIEEELLLECTLQNIDLCEVLCDISVLESGIV